MTTNIRAKRDLDTSIAVKRLGNDSDAPGDVTIDMGDISMAGMSDTSGGGIKKVNQSAVSDGSSMYDGGNDVQIVRAVGADNTQDMSMNESMAGLSDMSMGDIGQVQKVGEDSMADYSMASLGNDSMAEVEDSGFKQKYASGSTVAEESSGNEANMLGELKEEFAKDAL